jgi:hypothetical protein
LRIGPGIATTGPRRAPAAVVSVEYFYRFSQDAPEGFCKRLNEKKKKILASTLLSYRARGFNLQPVE